MSKKKDLNYGRTITGEPLRTQKEVIRNYFLTHPGKKNAISHGDCEKMFGFKRLSALVFDITNNDMIPVEREKRTVPTRYAGITSEPTFYWVTEEAAKQYIKNKQKI